MSDIEDDRDEPWSLGELLDAVRDLVEDLDLAVEETDAVRHAQPRESATVIELRVVGDHLGAAWASACRAREALRELAATQEAP